MDKTKLIENGIDCRWENKEDCTHQNDCIEFGRCIYLQEYEDRCL